MHPGGPPPVPLAAVELAVAVALVEPPAEPVEPPDELVADALPEEEFPPLPVPVGVLSSKSRPTTPQLTKNATAINKLTPMLRISVMIAHVLSVVNPRRLRDRAG